MNIEKHEHDPNVKIRTMLIFLHVKRPHMDLIHLLAPMTHNRFHLYGSTGKISSNFYEVQLCLMSVVQQLNEESEAAHIE